MYQITVRYGDTWEEIARIDKVVDYSIIEDLANAISCHAIFRDVAIIDNDTGEAVWTTEEIQTEEPADIDSDCGFDPYCGCYTDDC